MAEVTLERDDKDDTIIFTAKISRSEMKDCEFTALENMVLHDGDLTPLGLTENLRIIMTALERKTLWLKIQE